MGDVAAGLLQKLRVELLDGGVVVGFAQRHLFVGAVKRLGPQGLEVDKVADRGGLDADRRR